MVRKTIIFVAITEEYLLELYSVLIEMKGPEHHNSEISLKGIH